MYNRDLDQSFISHQTVLPQMLHLSIYGTITLQFVTDAAATKSDLAVVSKWELACMP